MKELTMLAILPGILIIIYIMKKDKVESESMGLIVKLLIFGALSTILAIFMENYITAQSPSYPSGTWSYALFNAFIIAGLCEEICKFIFLLVGSWNNREFNYRFDGIVYGVAVAVGFATVENVLYVFQYGFETGLARAVMSVPLHAFCGVFMGIFYGAAKAAKIKGTKGFMGNMVLCLIVPIIVHGIYDSMAFMSSWPTTIALLAFVVTMYIVGIKYIRKFSQDDWKNCFYENIDSQSESRRHTGHQQWSGSHQSGNKAGDWQYRQSGSVYDFNLSGHGAGSSYSSSNPIPVRVTNGFSIAGLICGILGLLTAGIFLLPSIAAIVLGVVGKIRTPMTTKNAVSTASVCLGIIGLVIGVFLYFYVLGM